MNIRTFVTILLRNPQYNFPKMRGGSKAVWNFFKNSSVLEMWGIPSIFVNATSLWCCQFSNPSKAVALPSGNRPAGILVFDTNWTSSDDFLGGSFHEFEILQFLGEKIPKARITYGLHIIASALFNPLMRVHRHVSHRPWTDVWNGFSCPKKPFQIHFGIIAIDNWLLSSIFWQKIPMMLRRSA